MSAYSDVILADTPVGYWRLQDATTAAAVDSSGNGNDWVLDTDEESNVPIMLEPSLLPGETGDRSIGWNGSEFVDLLMVVDDSASYSQMSSGSDTISVEFWYKFNVDDLRTVISLTGRVGTIGSDVAQWRLHAGAEVNVYADATLFNNAAAVWKQAYDADPTPVEGYVALTYDGTTLRFYQDGAVGSVTDASGSGTFQTGSTPAIRLYMDAFTYQSWVDEIAIYDYALSAAQVAAHYDAGSVVDLGVPPRIVAY